MILGHIITTQKNQTRLETFLRVNQRAGLDWKPFFAPSLDSFTRESLVSKGLIEQDLNPNWLPGTLSLAQANRSLWQQAVDTQQPMWIFEDDAYLADDLPGRVAEATRDLSSWDFLLLGCNTDSILDIRLSDHMQLRGNFSTPFPTPEQIKPLLNQGPPRAFRLNQAFGTCGTVVSPQGAQKLLDWVFPIRNIIFGVPALGKRLLCFSVDSMLNSLYPRIEAYTFLPPLAMAQNLPAESTIGKNEYPSQEG